jgi:hypothetical protein
VPDSPSDPSSDARPAALNQRWWWSGILWIVAVIQDGSAIWANWLMVAVGVVLAGLGAVRLWRAWQTQRTDVERTDGPEV